MLAGVFCSLFVRHLRWGGAFPFFCRCFRLESPPKEHFVSVAEDVFFGGIVGVWGFACGGGGFLLWLGGSGGGFPLSLGFFSQEAAEDRFCSVS